MTEPPDPPPQAACPTRRPLSAVADPEAGSRGARAADAGGATDDLFADPFHAIALFAYVRTATEVGGHPPVAATRRLAYRLYEDELARTNAARPRPSPGPGAILSDPAPTAGEPSGPSDPRKAAPAGAAAAAR